MAKILIVDDSRTARRILRSILEEAGHTIVGEAATGLEGYNQYILLNPDIVTMDVTMPIMDGIKSMIKIKEKDHNAKVIMVTSNAQYTKVAEAIAFNASGYVVKPVQAKELLDLIEKIL